MKTRYIFEMNDKKLGCDETERTEIQHTEMTIHRFERVREEPNEKEGNGRDCVGHDGKMLK